MDRKVRERIKDEMCIAGKMDKSYVVELIKKYDVKPDIDKLIEQSYKAKADRIISSFKDENGIRDCFAIKNSENKTQYISLANPRLLTKKEVEMISSKQSAEKKRKDEIIKKVKVAQQVIAGQIKLEDYMYELKRELEAV